MSVCVMITVTVLVHWAVAQTSLNVVVFLDTRTRIVSSVKL